MASKKEFIEDALKQDDAFEYTPDFDGDTEVFLMIEEQNKPVARNFLGFVRT